MKCDMYIDGSFKMGRDATGRDVGVYGSGIVILIEDVLEPVEIKFAGNNPDLAKQRNVAGEMMAAMNGVNTLLNNIPEIDCVNLIYDYEGIEKWVTGEWRAKNDVTATYRDFMRDMQKKCRIKFTHVYSHTGVYFNERVDALAKSAVCDKMRELNLDY